MYETRFNLWAVGNTVVSVNIYFIGGGMSKQIWVVVSDAILENGDVDAMACRAFTKFKDAQAFKRKLKEMYKDDDEEVNFTIQSCVLIEEVV